MPEPLTALERRVYQYMIDFLSENTYQPSIREIAKKFRIKSTKTVSDLLHSLSSKGYIERDQSRSRGVRILGYAAAGMTQPVPTYAKINATEPALSPDNRSGYITVDRRYVPSEDAFYLRAPDDTMSARGIYNSDLVMISPSMRAKDGDLVAARLGTDVFIRALARRGATVVLEPAQEGMHTLEVGPTDNFAVLGVVCAVFRPLFEQSPVPATITTDDGIEIPVS
jgi:repressor LexA